MNIPISPGRSVPGVVLALLLLLGLSILSSACTPAVQQVFPTPLPTATDTPIPSPTSTPLEPTAQPSPAVTAQVVYITTTPVFLTPRPELLFTRTPTAIPFGALRIDYFVADVTAVKPGESFLLFWSVQGVEQARIYRLTAEGEREQVWEVKREGSLLVRTREDDTNIAQFQLVIGDEITSVDQTVSIALSCTGGFFFENASPDCPQQTAAVTSPAAQQNFEHGIMVWLEAEGQIYVLFSDGGSPAWQGYTDEFKDGQPESDPSFVPPAGLLQPVRGFGLLWRNRSEIRDRLGWAVGSELAYTAQIQGDVSTLKYVLLQEGDVAELTEQGKNWRRFSVASIPATPTETETTTP
ncbi:MAG: hypothetical protein KF726_08220 [Anaerolineae bacterium]|nr:hypothetical protein [Anaerolineae bacterium]